MDYLACVGGHGYTLTFLSPLLFADTLSDRIFVVAPAACGFLAPSLDVLVAAHVAQGVGAALITPILLALLREACQQSRDRARAPRRQRACHFFRV